MVGACVLAAVRAAVATAYTGTSDKEISLKKLFF